jgi:hypothetical protein
MKPVGQVGQWSSYRRVFLKSFPPTEVPDAIELICPTARPVRCLLEEWLDFHRETGGGGIVVGFPYEVLEIYADHLGDAFWRHQHPGMKIHRYRHDALIGLKVSSVRV